jgi:hypothetical protein
MGAPQPCVETPPGTWPGPRFRLFLGASGNRSRSRPALAQRPHPLRPRRLAPMRRRRTSATGPRTARGGSGTAANTMIFEPCITTPRATQACPTRSPTPTLSTRARASKAGTPAARGEADGGGRGREETRDASLAVAAPARNWVLSRTIRARPSPSRVSTGRAITLELLIARNHRMWISCCSTTD